MQVLQPWQRLRGSTHKWVVLNIMGLLLDCIPALTIKGYQNGTLTLGTIQIHTTRGFPAIRHWKMGASFGFCCSRPCFVSQVEALIRI